MRLYVRDQESVEVGARRGGVGAYAVEHEPVPHLHLRQLVPAHHLVAGVARRPEHRRRVLLLAAGRKLGGERPGARHVVAQDGAAEGAVDAVVDPVLAHLAARAPADDPRRERECRLGEVLPRLADHLHAAPAREVLRERVADGLRRPLERGVRHESAADVEHAHGRHAELRGRVERRASGLDRAAVHVDAGRARPDVERHAGDAEPRALRGPQERDHLVGARAVLGAEVDLGVRVVGALDAEEEVAARVAALHLGHLVLGVVGGEVDAHLGRVPEVRLGLARVRVHDAPGPDDAEREDGLDLGAAGAVESRAESRHRAQHRRLGVALDGVVGPHAVQRAAPAAVQVDDLGEVKDEEGALLLGASDGAHDAGNGVLLA
uniref:Uncharacterized protein n=1 Tax=Triticum urartu TaxID=4572 RepID=A0A8R7V1S6_TRIUA